METYIKRFSKTRITDTFEVGGKNAALGEAFSNLVPKGVRVPDGFAVNIAAFRHFLSYNGLGEKLEALMKDLRDNGAAGIAETGAKARALFKSAKFPPQVENAIVAAYNQYFSAGEEVAVRSSAATAEFAQESFTGLHESFLNIRGALALVYSIKCCYASLYSDRAIQYREDNGIDHCNVSLSIGVQRMVRSDLASSGTGYTGDLQSAGNNVVRLTGAWGLGLSGEHAQVNPDEFVVSKPSPQENEYKILQKVMGSKSRMLVYNENAAGTNTTLDKTTPRELRAQFVLNDDEVQQLAQWAVLIEQHYGAPVQFEWAKDGIDNCLYIIQAQPRIVTAHCSTPA